MKLYRKSDKYGETMYKILIVDDEYDHRKGLMNLLLTLQLNSLIFEASDGMDAIDIIDIMDCDIVITDIKMENIDGLQLLKIIKEKKPEIEVVILSGYGQFEYAKRALKYGAADYLMKPVDKAEIKNIINNIINKLDEKKEEKCKRKTLSSQLNRTMPVYIDHLMNTLVRKKEFPQKNQLKELFPLEKRGYVFLCNIEMNHNQYHAEVSQIEIRQEMKKCLDPFSSYSFFLENQQTVLVVCVLADSMIEQEKCDEIRKHLLRNFAAEISFFIGKITNNLYEEASDSFEEAYELYQYYFYELGWCLYYRNLKNKIEGPIDNYFSDISQIIESVKHFDIYNSYRQFELLINKKIDGSLPLPSVLKQMVIYALFQITREFEIMLSQDSRRIINNKIHEIPGLKTISLLRQYLYLFFVYLVGELEKQKDSNNTEILKHCKKYLENHFMDEISLELMAEKYFFNASYFSTLFKNYFHKPFSEYLIELRMVKAKELLQDTNEKIRKIAPLVGYKDTNYFVRSFKRYSGFTPEEYRKLNCRIE
ncbi:MAG: response regulator [Herbinix sp.]|nr:response regulator [Herbinix sp.]